MTLKAFATIRHNDNERDDRVTLYEDLWGNVWAAARGERPYQTDRTRANAADAWRDPAWDYREEPGEESFV